MNDVIPPCGGYLPVYVENNGYITGIEADELVHRETRDMDEWNGCFDSFEQAKTYMLDMPDDPMPEFHDDLHAVLELNGEGGGAVIWTLPEWVEEVTARRNRFRGCYGTWPVRSFTV